MCADLGGSLAEVNSEAEHTALSQYYASVNSPVLPIQGAVSSFLTKLSNMRRQHSAWWTAGQYHMDTGHWSWADNRYIWTQLSLVSHPQIIFRTMTDFTNWHPHNRHDQEKEKCLALIDNDSLHWISLPCDGRKDGSLKVQPLCERKTEYLIRKLYS